MNKKQLAAIEKAGFSVPDVTKLPTNSNLNGIITKDGTFISCNGFNEHRYLYPFLFDLGLVDCSDWIDETTAIHITSNQLTGSVVSELEYPELMEGRRNGRHVTEAQLNTMFALRKILDGTYGSREEVADIMFKFHSYITNHGGKYNGLSFLRKYYTHINTPLIGTSYTAMKAMLGNVREVCVRTSPKKSLPGLLHSKFNLTNDTVDQSVKEIKADFEKYKDLVRDNAIHWFFQEQLEGVNGVCHMRGYKDRKFSYSASATQGDIVQGKKGKVKLSDNVRDELKKIATELAEDFNMSIQLEFVVCDDKLYIVQFRILTNEPEYSVRFHKPENTIANGNTFSHGYLDVYVKDIAVVTVNDATDGDSSILIGKKALIVTNNVEFSHLLALSKALRIPSIYGTGKIDFGNEKVVHFVAYNEKGWVEKSKKRKVVYETNDGFIRWKKEKKDKKVVWRKKK